MAYIVADSVTVATTGAAGSTQYSNKVFNGFIMGIRSETVDLTSTGTITITGETNGYTYWSAVTATTGNVENHPRGAAVESSGASTSINGQAVMLPVSNERLKIVLGGMSTGITSTVLKIFVEGSGTS